MSMGLLGLNRGPWGVRGVLCNEPWLVLVLFSKNVGIVESNEAEVLSIPEALWIFSSASFLCPDCGK